MTFTVKALVRSGREITTNIAGCQTEEEARQKFLRYYEVVKFKWVKPVEENKK